jgi:integrase
MNLSTSIEWMQLNRAGWKPTAKGSVTAITNANHCLEILGDINVEDINATSFTNLQFYLLEAGYKNATVNRKCRALSTILNSLKRHELLERSVPYYEELPEPRRKVVYYTDEEVLAILGQCQNIADGELVANAIRLASLTGCRKGELLKLEWSDVYWQQQELVFRDTKNKGEDRWLPITPDLMRLLQQMYHERINDGVLFDIHPDALLRRLKKAQQLAGLDTTVKNFHSFRHTAATNLFAKGAELPVVMEVLGHSNARTTMRYAHARSDRMREALATL